MSDCISWLSSFFVNIFALLDNLYISAGVSILGIMVACYVLYMIVDNFVPKG